MANLFLSRVTVNFRNLSENNNKWPLKTSDGGRLFSVVHQGEEGVY